MAQKRLLRRTTPEFSSEENSSLRQDGYDVEMKL
jgi:hypothetical protein